AGDADGGVRSAEPSQGQLRGHHLHVRRPKGRGAEEAGHQHHVRRWPLRRRLVWAALLVVVGCGDVEKGTAPPPTPLGAARPGTPAPPGSPVAALQPGVEQSKEALLAEVRKRQLGSEDFKEAVANRDPFRSFLTTFGTQVINI